MDDTMRVVHSCTAGIDGREIVSAMIDRFRNAVGSKGQTSKWADMGRTGGLAPRGGQPVDAAGCGADGAGSCVVGTGVVSRSRPAHGQDGMRFIRGWLATGPSPWAAGRRVWPCSNPPRLTEVTCRFARDASRARRPPRLQELLCRGGATANLRPWHVAAQPGIATEGLQRQACGGKCVGSRISPSPPGARQLSE